MTRFSLFTCLLLTTALPPLWAESPATWIWSRQNSLKDEKALLRADFNLPTLPAKAVLRWTCDNKAEVVLNGKRLGHCKNWEEPVTAKLDGILQQGPNWLATVVANEGAGSAGLLLEIVDKSVKPEKVIFSSGDSWKWQPTIPEDWQTVPTDAAAMQPTVKLGEYGMKPWGKVFDFTGPDMSVEACKIKAPAGFNVEHVYAVPKTEQGSWVSLTIDDKGRFIARGLDLLGIQVVERM